MARQREIRIEAKSTAELESISGITSHQGVVARCEPYRFADVDDVASGEFVIALDGVEDPRNFGAIIRVADATAASGIIVPERRNAPITAATQKAAAGAIEHVPIASVTNLANTLRDAKKGGSWIVGLDADGDEFAECPLLDERVVLVAGAEGSGIRRRVAQMCDVVCALPMRGSVASLNVATAVAVAAFEIARRHDR